jgi:hypothetical protein
MEHGIMPYLPMAKTESKQQIANLIQAEEATLRASRAMYNDPDMKGWALNQSEATLGRIKEQKKKLKEVFELDYDATDANTKVVKEGSKVKVLVDHMKGMKGGTATVKSYAQPAMLSDVVMKDGMKMNGHKWLINDEVEL